MQPFLSTLFIHWLKIVGKRPQLKTSLSRPGKYWTVGQIFQAALPSQLPQATNDIHLVDAVGHMPKLLEFIYWLPFIWATYTIFTQKQKKQQK